MPSLEGARKDIIELFTRTPGYSLLPEPGIDPSEADLTQLLRALCRQRIRPEDHVVMYLGCHGQILENGRHVLMAADADPADEAFLLPTVRLAEALLMDTPLRRLLLVLDTCYSGTGGNQAAAAALNGMERDWTGPGDSGLVIVTATRPFEQARPGALPRLLADAVNAPSTAGRIPAALDLGTVVARAVHRAFVEVLGDVPYGTDATRDWSRAHPYALRHLATHALAAGRLDALLSDVGYLVHSDPDTLLPALPHAHTAAGRTVRAVYTASAVAHRTASPARRHRLLALDAARYGAADLADALNEGLVARPRWAAGGMLNPFLHSVVAGASGAMACGEVDGAAVLVTALGGRVAVLDPATGRATAAFTGHRTRVTGSGTLKVACGAVDGEPVGLSRLPGNDGDEVFVWDLRTGTPRCALVGHPSGLSAMACATVDGTPVAVTPVTGLTFDTEGALVVAADREVLVLDVDTERLT